MIQPRRNNNEILYVCAVVDVAGHGHVGYQMKTLSLLLIIAAVTVRLETETPVTLHITDVSSSRYVTAGNKGALDSSSKRIGPKQTFTLVDTNDGKMEDGNTVRIKWNTTYWQEDRANGKVVRCPGKEMDATTCTFKVKKQGQLIALQTASGKFVSAPTDGTALVTTNTLGVSTFFELIQNPPAQ
jgi:hypothetical protein